jgi:sigma-B regulation protein RsbU (phosphoserine phosphatase)
MARELAVTSPDGKTRTMPLDGLTLSLGRSAANDLCYPEDIGLSRQHMVLERDGGEWTVRDLNSKNGTFLNGIRISQKTPLNPGDRIVASRIILTYEPAREESNRTVLFEGHSPSPAGMTVATTLESLLQRRPKDWPAAGGGAAALEWASPITALVRAGRELTVRRPLPELYEVILNLAMESCGARRGVLLTLEKDNLVVQASRGEGFRISSTVRDRVLNAKTSLLVRDAQQDEALRMQYSIVEHRVGTLMAVPLQTDNQVIGLLYVDSPQLTREFTSDDLNLLTIMANVAGLRIERERLAEIEQAEKLMAAELEQAAEIQRQLLPAAAPAAPGLDLAGYNAACRTVGGDYYDFVSYPDGRIGLVIADVAGKGMPAALLMAGLQAKVQALADTPGNTAEMVGRLNRGMAATCPSNRFVTLFFGVLDPRTGELAFCNAGHNPPFLVRPSGDIMALEGGGPVLGVLPAMRYEEQHSSMGPGDVLLLYSDGVTEACNPEGEEFEDRVKEILVARRDDSAAAIVQAVHEAVAAWTAGQPATDDITVVAARRLP